MLLCDDDRVSYSIAAVLGKGIAARMMGVGVVMLAMMAKRMCTRFLITFEAWIKSRGSGAAAGRSTTLCRAVRSVQPLLL